MSKRTCYECENFFTSSFCGYDACYCKIHGSTWKVIPDLGMDGILL